MEELDAIAPSFRRAKERWPDGPTLSNHYASIRSEWEGNAHGVLEKVKSFIECVCLTILGEFGKPMPSSAPTTTDLFVAALKPLGLENSRDAREFSKVLSAHNKLADALGEVRDRIGPVAHGKDGFLDALSRNHGRMFLLAGDTLLALLLNAYEGIEPDLEFTREPYDRFAHLHDRIDTSVVVDVSIDNEGDRPMIVFSVHTGNPNEVRELRIEPSKALYCLDRLAYIDVLASSALVSLNEEGGVEESEKPEMLDKPHRLRAESHPEVEVASASYEGRLLPLKDGLAKYLESLGVPETAESGVGILDSVLATADKNMGIDWDKRDSIRAKLKISIRRALTRLGVASEKADESAAHLVTWFEKQNAGISREAERSGHWP